MLNTIKQSLCLCIAILTFTAVTEVYAGPMGAISTDRFGYTGTVNKYDTLANAQNGGTTGLLESITIDNRDISLYIVNDYTAYGTDFNSIMGSWWYTISNPYQGDGWGNTHGNTGIGFLQLYDFNGSTDSTVDFSFSDFDGTYWTQFTLTLSGSGANYANAYARFSPFASNTNDKGTYLQYTLTLVATGLEGTETSPGFIEAFDHPEGVTGQYTGIFQNTDADTGKQGFYVYDLTLDMTNWAYENRNSLTGPNLYNQFSDSYFAASSVPEPTSLALLSLGLVGLGYRRWRKA